MSESLGLSPYRVETHSEWININVFSARLTALNVADSSPQVGILCDRFLEEDEVRENPVLFDLAVSAAAQRMIYAASHVYRSCEKIRTWG